MKKCIIDAQKKKRNTILNLPDNDFNIDFTQALTVLNEDERAAILLFYMEDQTISKISKIMKHPTGTIKSHLHRGKEKLVKYFKNEHL